MHQTCQMFTQDAVSRFGLRGEVFEVGSRDVNGTVRDLIPCSSWVGIDMGGPGPGVDVVANGHAIPLASNSRDVAVCLNILEHDTAPWLTLGECLRVLRPGGYILANFLGPGWPVHEYPEDLWRWMPLGGPRLLQTCGFDVLGGKVDAMEPSSLFVLGRKPQLD